jgi:hypothetical protein
MAGDAVANIKTVATKRGRECGLMVEVALANFSNLLVDPQIVKRGDRCTDAF